VAPERQQLGGVQFLELRKGREATVPCYFFNMVEGDSKILLRDVEGTIFSSVSEARKEAVALARDVARHDFPVPAQTWKVVVTDENGDEVLTVPLSGIRVRKSRAWLNLAGYIAKCESSFRRHTFVLTTTAAVLAVIVQAATTTVLVRKHDGGYQTASALAECARVTVRFVPHASVADVTKFLSVYKASLIGGPRPGDLYYLHIANTNLPPRTLAEIVNRMMQEKVIEFAAAVP
jgi:hypothetical protein